ncbi:MAG: hypothetical protein WDN69_12580 [Aliidongia sp.]
MRALIALTVFMGVLIIAGLAVIVVTVIHRLSAPKPVAAVTGPVTAGASGHASVAVPSGARLTATTAVGDRVVLHLVTEGGRDTLITLDPSTGAVLETIDLVPENSSVEHP